MADLSTSYVTTAASYVALAAVGYGVYYMSTQKSRQKAATSQSKPAAKASVPEPRKEDRKKKQRLESFTSETRASKDKSYAAKAAEPSTAVQDQKPAKVANDDVDNKEFARQLSQAQQGKSFASGGENGKKQKEKSVKQSRAQEKVSKPVAAPVVPAIDPEPVNEVANEVTETQADDPSGVADMLEPASAAPSVLRLTDTESTAKPEKAAKAAEPVETKKQRQNRKKAEAAKAAREEAEIERKALEEKQRRAARLAEGRAAKDGSQFTAAAIKNSAWNNGAPNDNKAAATPATNGNHQLLDTFDAESSAAAPKSDGQAKPNDWVSSLPSEEEQIKQLQDDDEWNTVTTKAAKRSAKKTTSFSGDEATAAPAAPAPAPAANVQQAAAAPKAAPQPTKPTGSQNFGSFSALSTKDDPAEEVEEEWDV